MPQYLLESDLSEFSFSLSEIVSRNKTNTSKANDASNTSDVSKADPAKAKASKAKRGTAGASTDWGKVLKQRLEANQALDPESRESDQKIESEFWSEFFNATWEADIAKKLIAIDLLKKDIKVLGFNAKVNPLIAFLKDKYVQTNLITTGLFNSSTFNAIHNALAKKYIAHSEFKKANSYNILYCKDLYSKPVADMITYFMYQSKNLPVNIESYQEERLNRNKRIFLQVGKDSVLKDAKLNSLNEIKQLLKNMGVASSNELEQESQKNTNTGKTSKDFNMFVQQLKDLAQIHAALLFISMATGFEGATKALKALPSDESFKSADLTSAALKNSKFLSSTKLSASDASTLVDLLLDRYQEIKS